MAAKLLAALLAVLVVGGFGVYYSLPDAPATTEESSASLEVSEHSCCATRAAKLKSSCDADSPTCELAKADATASSSDALAACTGAMTVATNVAVHVE